MTQTKCHFIDSAVLVLLLKNSVTILFFTFLQLHMKIKTCVFSGTAESERIFWLK